MAKAQYSKPASQLDLEARQKNGNKSDRVLSTSDQYEGNAPEADAPGYVGTDLVYQTAANHTEAPGTSTKGAEAKVFEQFTGEEPEDIAPEADEPDEPDQEEESSDSTSSTGSVS
jgi:hypothetical protein